MQSFRDGKLQSSPPIRRVSRLQRCLLETIGYADIFDYPLTLEEWYRFLITDQSPRFSLFKKLLSRIIANDKRINTNGKFYFFQGRENIVALRQKREGWSKEKIAISRKTAEKLGKFCWVKMVGLTGALAMRNSDLEDDIDLMIVTSKNRLWLTRWLIYSFCPILGIKRRKPKDKEVQNEICFNLFLDEDHLKISPENLFLAHEICQVKPLVNKDKTYERFLWENRWAAHFLPNAKKISNFKFQISNFQKKGLFSQYLNILLFFFEKLAYKLQYFYMQPKITREKISPHQAFFHPRDLSKEIEREYKIRLSSKIL